MEFSCQKCHSSLRISDEKIPDDKVFNIICPKCKDKISIDKKTVAIKPQKVTDFESLTPEISKNAAPESYTNETITNLPDEPTVEFHEEGKKTALICDDNKSNQDILKNALEELAYKTTTGKNPEDALKKIHLDPYDVIVLHEEFGGFSASDNPVLNRMQPMYMSIRRNIFFALIGQSYSTLDNLMAFSKSADIVINQKDLPHIKSILRRAISENDNFYKIFKTY